MKKTSTIIIAMLAIAATALKAQARIGETYEQAYNRYGQETKIWTDGETSVYQFDKGVYHIAVVFDPNGKIWEIAYLKRDAYGAWTDLSYEENLKLLQNNKQKGWQFLGEMEGIKIWTNGNNLTASYGWTTDVSGTSYPRLRIVTKASEEHFDKIIKDEAIAAQEGL
jgi:outer membrane receptor for ferric coprogen and ferric-rhodotorulic acid